MHARGVVHGDLRCDNILVKGTTTQAKVCHFDHAFDWVALKKKKRQQGSAEAAGVRISGYVRWLAPECLQGTVLSPASDVYSFGMTLYEALTGKLPFYHLSSDDDVKAAKLTQKSPARESELISAEA